VSDRSTHVLSRVVAVATVLAAVTACQAAPSGPGASVPLVTPAVTPVRSRAATAPASTATASPGASTAAPGSWTVTLAGPRDGAGSYSGVAFVICAAPTENGRLYWTATMIDPAGPITEISLQQNPSGFDSVSVTGPGGMETGQWFARSDTPGGSATVAGSGGPGGARVAGDATFTDTQGTTFTIHAAVECSDTSF
jgi:hypothetical protein